MARNNIKLLGSHLAASCYWGGANEIPQSLLSLTHSVVFFSKFYAKYVIHKSCDLPRGRVFDQKITFDHKGEGGCLADPKFGSWDLWTALYLNTSHNHVANIFYPKYVKVINFKCNIKDLELKLNFWIFKESNHDLAFHLMRRLLCYVYIEEYIVLLLRSLCFKFKITWTTLQRFISWFFNMWYAKFNNLSILKMHWLQSTMMLSYLVNS